VAERASAQQDSLIELEAAPGVAIGKRLRLFDADGRRAVYFGTTPIHVYDRSDREAEAACIATLSRARLASDIQIASGFGVHRNTVGRISARFAREGMAAVVPSKRGPKGRSKVTDDVMAVIAASVGLPVKELRQEVADRTGVWISVPHLYRLVAAHRPAQGELELGSGACADGDLPQEGAAVSDAEAGCAGGEDEAAHGVGPVGEGFEPPVVLPERTHGPYMGLALYYPALAAVGLVDVAREVFRLPRSERFGVRAVTLSLFFLTLLGKGTVESAKHLRRAAFGAVCGTGRAPAVKTLRRKLACLVGQAQAAAFGTGLARRWVAGGVVATAYLYVDGHMKVYSGKRRLQEVWNSQRRMPLPGVHTYHVSDSGGRPLLFLTEQLSTNLAKAMPRIIEAIREVIGDRPFTVIFDRGGYDGELFAWLDGQGISFITYQRGSPNLPTGSFKRAETRFEGRRVRFMIASDQVKVAKSGPWRRIVIRSKDGHQTPILTNLGPQVGAARIACLMFARWRQENLFKYMGAHHGLDNLISYAFDAASENTMVPNPERKRLDREITDRRKKLAALKADLGDAVLDEPKNRSRTAHGLKIAQGGTVGRLRELEEEIAALVAQRKATPKRVAISESNATREVMRLEAKAIVDRIKIAAYNAEEWLLDRLVMHYQNPHDQRDLLRSFAELSGEIDTQDSKVIVTLDPPDTPLHRRVLCGLIQDLNRHGATFPGTDIPVTYQVAVHHSRAAA
jgi:transposase